MVAIPSAAEDVLTPEELEMWIEIIEEAHTNPQFLEYLKEKDPKAFEFFVGQMRRVQSVGARRLWRAADGGPGAARPEQLLPGTPGSFSRDILWRVWLIMAGRGAGKSWAAAHAVREILLDREWRSPPHFALVSATLEDVRIDMIEGALEQVLGDEIDRYNRSSLEIWLKNGAFLKGYSSERPSRLRGPNFVGAWADEVAAWLDADLAPSEGDTTWSNLEFATRSADGGDWSPRIIATTTPKPVRLLRVVDKNDDFHPGLVDDPEVVVSHMTTTENRKNLAPAFYRRLRSRYEGTRIGQQEIEGILLDQIEGALWSMDTIAGMRSSYRALSGLVGGWKSMAVAVDPTIGDGAASNDECGIMVGCLGFDGKVYVVEDATVKGPPTVWCKAVGDAYFKWGANLVIAERNQGGELVKEALHRYISDLPLQLVHAKDSKRARAEGPALLCEQGEVKFAYQRQSNTEFALLQNQLMTWDPINDTESPDRLDAFVYLVQHFRPARFTARANSVGRHSVGSRGRARRARRHAAGAKQNPLNRRDPARNPRSKSRTRRTR